MTRNELYFEFCILVRQHLTFSKTKAHGEILDLFNKIGKIYVQRNLNIFINNKSILNDFDKVMRIIKFPYYPLTDQSKKTHSDSKTVKRNFINSLTEIINELNIKVSDSELNALEIDKMYLQDFKQSIQLDIDFDSL